MMSARSWPRQAALVLGVALVYFVAAEIGLSFAFIHSNVSPVWPPSGVAIAAILIFGMRIWPGILLGAFAANFLTPIPFAATLAIATGNTLEAVSAGYLLNAIKFNKTFDQAKDVLKFLVAAMLCSSVSATIGNVALFVTGASVTGSFESFWITWWLGDLTGALTFGPLLLVWLTRSQNILPQNRLLEAAILILLLSVAAIATWSQSAPTPVRFYPLTRLIVPFLLWAAFRLGHRGVTLAILTVSAFAVWGTVHDSGPFVGTSPNDSLMVLQLFIGTNAVTFLFLVAVVEERRRAEEAVRKKETELAQVTDSTPLMLTRCTRDLRYAFVNRAYADMLGLDPKQIIGKPIVEVMGQTGFDIIRPYINKVLGGEQVSYEEGVDFAGVGTRFLRVTYSPDHDSRGNVVGWIASIADVSDRKAAETALQLSESELTEFFENATEAIHWVGPTGTILRANRAELRMLGYAADEYVGRDIAEFHVDKDKIADILERLGRGESIENYSAQMICKDGSVRDVLINSSVYFENGKFIHTRCFTRDVTEQLRAEKGLRHLAAIVQSTDDVIIAMDLSGVITSCNAAAERLYGYKADEMVGESVSLLIPPERAGEELSILAKLQAGGRIDHYESVRVAKDGKRIDVSLTISPIFNRAGQVIGASKIARDVTDVKRAQEERERLLEREEKARADAEAANRVKDEFLATLSHELRTPLNAIMGWASMLRGQKLSEEEARKAIEIIDRNAKVQSRLIEGVLDVSRIVSGKFQIECRPVQLRDVVTAAVDSIRPAADARNIRLHLIVEQKLAIVAGDFNRLQQVVWNLLSNAVKFTEPGGVIRVELRTIAPNVEIVVSDTGHGISADFLPHVFDRFRQADSSTTRKHGGLGLGLAIVRHLVELHGGSVEAESEGVGQGATFRVRLPMLSDNLARSLEQSEEKVFEIQDPIRLLRGLRILVVEDDGDARELLLEMLSACEAEVKSVSSAREALDVMKEWKPEVLVSDISMPEIDGYAFLERVRALETNGALAAIAVTAHAREEDRERALRAGFHAYLSKPVELPELAATIARATGKLPKLGEA